MDNDAAMFECRRCLIRHFGACDGFKWFWDHRLNRSKVVFGSKRRKKTRFAVGHIALGYILGKASARSLKTDLNIPLAMTLCVIPDMDILLENIGLAQVIPHRGPMHSFLAALIVFIPFFALYRKKAVPYFIALVQHSLIGDYLTGGKLQLLWPITLRQFGTARSIFSLENVTLEFLLFISSIALLLVTRDVYTLFRSHRSNLVLAVPTFTVLLPIFLSYPLEVPVLLILPHLVYTFMFLATIVIEVVRFLRPQGNEGSSHLLEKKGASARLAAAVSLPE